MYRKLRKIARVSKTLARGGLRRKWTRTQPAFLFWSGEGGRSMRTKRRLTPISDRGGATTFFGECFLTIYRKTDFFAFFGGFSISNCQIIYIYVIKWASILTATGIFTERFNLFTWTTIHCIAWFYKPFLKASFDFLRCRAWFSLAGFLA